MLSKVAAWRPAKFACKYVLKTLLIFSEAFYVFSKLAEHFIFRTRQTGRFWKQLYCIY